MNKYFFSSIKECSAVGLITKLYDDETNVVSSSASNPFYSKLYTKASTGWTMRRMLGGIVESCSI